MTEPTDSTLEAQVGLKIDPDLRDRLTRQAHRNGRSLSGEIRYRLAESLRQDETDLRQTA